MENHPRVISSYPNTYREKEISAILDAVRSGECFSLIGLSGAGKTNLLAHLASLSSRSNPVMVVIDGNRMEEPTSGGLFRLVCRSLGQTDPPVHSSDRAFESFLQEKIQKYSICLLFDLSMAFSRFPELAAEPFVNGLLRSLRDANKYRLTYLFATRHPLPDNTELAELFFANTGWLGPLAAADALWSVDAFAARKNLRWDNSIADKIIAVSGGYPALLRAVCEAYEDGSNLAEEALANHSAVQRRLDEFWSDHPSQEEIHFSGLDSISLLKRKRDGGINTDILTAKEQLLLSYLRDHAGKICMKDELIRAIWPEDKIMEQGVRDDSLSQLVRRLREKVELDPSKPTQILTMAGRGYRFKIGQ